MTITPEMELLALRAENERLWSVLNGPTDAGPDAEIQRLRRELVTEREITANLTWAIEQL